MNGVSLPGLFSMTFCFLSGLDDCSFAGKSSISRTSAAAMVAVFSASTGGYGTVNSFQGIQLRFKDSVTSLVSRFVEVTVLCLFLSES